MVGSQEEASTTGLGKGQAAQDNWLRIANQYLAEPLFHDRDDVTSRYFQRIIELRRQGRERFAASDVDDLHPRAKGDLTKNVEAEMSRLRGRIAQVAKKQGLQEITLTNQRGTATYLIGLGAPVTSYADHSEVIIFSSPWSSVLRWGAVFVLSFLIPCSLLTAYAIFLLPGLIVPLGGASLVFLVAVSLFKWIVALVNVGEDQLRDLWPTRFYLRLVDGFLIMEQIWFPCPKCEARGKRTMMIPRWNRRSQQWVMRCRKHRTSHSAAFDFPTYRVGPFLA